MHLSSADEDRRAAGRAIAIACQEQSCGSVEELRFARNAAARERSGGVSELL
jgi:hypothetical protein